MFLQAAHKNTAHSVFSKSHPFYDLTDLLFLPQNKCDLLKRKLKRGIKVKTYLPSYGDRPNEVMPVVKCQSKDYQEAGILNSLQISARNTKRYRNSIHPSQESHTSTRRLLRLAAVFSYLWAHGTEFAPRIRRQRQRRYIPVRVFSNLHAVEVYLFMQSATACCARTSSHLTSYNTYGTLTGWHNGQPNPRLSPVERPQLPVPACTHALRFPTLTRLEPALHSDLLLRSPPDPCTHLLPYTHTRPNCPFASLGVTVFIQHTGPYLYCNCMYICISCQSYRAQWRVVVVYVSCEFWGV
jgi:hypothetical protein